jgi:hypothetical protein
MFARLFMGTLGCIALLQGGCARSGPDKTDKAALQKPASAGTQTITLHVEGMAKQLNLF